MRSGSIEAIRCSCRRAAALAARRFAALPLIVAASLGAGGCAHDGSAADWWLDSRRYAVAADHAAASAAGAELLARGGNAVDAAVATSFALAVVRPESCGLGGGGFMLIHRPGAAPLALDFRETAPAGAALANYVDASGRPIPGRTEHGGWAVAVPGQVAGLLYALERFGSGRVRRADVLAPAIRLAREPLAVDRHLHESIVTLADACRERPDYGRRFEPLRRVLLDDHDRPRPVGAIVDRRDLIFTLERIALQGRDGFYGGPVAERLIDAVRADGGPLAPADLAAYQPRELAPLRGRFGAFELLSMPPPSSGGAVVLQVLGVVGARHAWSTRDPADAHLLIESFKHAFADRARFLGDCCTEVDIDVARMVEPGQALRVQSAIDPMRTRESARYGMSAAPGPPPAAPPPDDRGTSHYCVVDSSGMAVAGTDTINLEFGSYLLAPGTGVILNNEMDDFAVDADTPNAYGLRQSPRNLIAPGRRPLSSMSPTIVLRDGRVEMVAGGSGGPRIITSTIQVILNVLAGGMSAHDAVAAPRLHHQWLPDVIRVQNGFPTAALDGLRERGHRVREPEPSLAHVQTIVRTENGWQSACDPAKGGRPAGG